MEKLDYLLCECIEKDDEKRQLTGEEGEVIGSLLLSQVRKTLIFRHLDNRTTLEASVCQFSFSLAGCFLQLSQLAQRHEDC